MSILDCPPSRTPTRTLRSAVEDYLTTRRALGFKLKRSGQLLGDFADWCERQGLETVTVSAAVAWSTSPAEADRYWWATRLAAVRVFARWERVFDPATEVPPTDLLPVPKRRAEPYPYTDHDIAALIGAAGSIRTPLKAATYRTLIGLLAVTGMRVGEAIALDRIDVDFEEALLVVRAGKFGKSREVMLHPTTVDALAGYDTVRRGHCPRPATSSFFVSTTGTRLIYQNVHDQFHRLVRAAGIEPVSPRCRPRPHDLRHRFAVTTLLGWYRDGVDVAARLPALSTYLGHLAPSDTYWYLTATPELLAIAADRLETTGTADTADGPRQAHHVGQAPR